MALAATAIVARLDSAQEYRPWFLIRGSNGIPASVEHASWDLGDMTGRYLEGLILTRRMGVSQPEFSAAEGRLGRYLLKLLGPDGLVHDPGSGAVDHTFSQGSALYGLAAWWEDSSDPAVRLALERLITGLLRKMQLDGDKLVDPSVKLEKSSGSHLAGYGIYPIIRFYELTGYPDALVLAEGLTRWVIQDPVLGPDGAITLPLSWEGHIHSWLDALAGCARTARISTRLERAPVLQKSRAVYDWVRRSNTTDFGWIATFPTHGSSETCAISSAVRLALELAASGHPEYFNDVERFVRNQALEAQFRDLNCYQRGSQRATPLLLGCFDSQSMPNGHLGTRGEDDAGTVEGCCLNGGMRALALAWNAVQSFDERGVSIHLALTQHGPAASVVDFQPFEGRLDVIPRAPGIVRVRLPDWAPHRAIQVLTNDRPASWQLQTNGPYALISPVRGGTRVSLRYPLRDQRQKITAGGRPYTVTWKGDTVVEVDPPGAPEPAYQNRLQPRSTPFTNAVPDTYEWLDAARLGSLSMLARLDLARGGQPFFRIYPFATPPRAEHEKWDDGDMSGRYVEALMAARHMTGIPCDARENTLRSYLANLFDPDDGLCYTRAATWTPRRACLFSQSCAMLGLLAWHAETGSPNARQLLDRHVDGLMRIALDRGDYAFFPKYEYDGKSFVDEPKDQDAPTWYGGRLILPLVEYWQLSQREDVHAFLSKLIRYSTEISRGIKPDGEVVGESWWSHLHSTMDMAAGIAEFGRLTRRPELVAWSQRVYDWVGRQCTTRYGWVSDIARSPICESCAIGSRFRLGLALYRAGAADPFGEIDRHLRNQLLENQFIDLDFLAPLEPDRPRTDRATYANVDTMIRGTFQCWGTANDLIGHDDIEGCGAGGGVQALHIAWQAQSEWRPTNELRLHLLFNRRVRAPADGLTTGAPIAAEVWSFLPYEGRAKIKAHQEIPRLAVRIPDGADLNSVRVRREPLPSRTPAPGPPLDSTPEQDGRYAIVHSIRMGDTVEIRFALNEFQTDEVANQVHYTAHWKGSAVTRLEPPGKKVPLYTKRAHLQGSAPLAAPRYP